MSGNAAAAPPQQTGRPVVVVSEEARWEAVPEFAIASERADTEKVSNERWNVIYADFAATADPAKDEVFSAVNAYFAKNGSSPEGGYKRPIRANGKDLSADVIVKRVGTADGAIRKFLRGKLKDSTLALKHSKAIRKDPEMCAQALLYGLSPEQAWLLADWLVPKNTYLTVEEEQIATRIRTGRISTANSGRGNAPVGVAGIKDGRAAETKVSAVEKVDEKPAYAGTTLF